MRANIKQNIVIACSIIVFLVATVFLGSTVGFLLMMGVTATLWHRFCKWFWVATLGAAVSGSLTWSGIFVFLILAFDPWFSSGREALSCFRQTLIPCFLIGLPVALVVGLWFRTRRKRIIGHGVRTLGLPSRIEKDAEPPAGGD